MVGNKCVACATSCTVHIAQSLEDASTKDSTNGWTEQEITGRSWDVSVDALVAVDATGETVGDLIDLLLGDTKATLKFTQTEGNQNRTEESSPIITLTGSAWCNDISISAANKQNATYTAQFTGDGALTKA